MAGVNIEIQGIEELGSLFRRVTAKIADKKTVFQDVGEYLLQSHEARWNQEVSPEGTPWAKLSPWYEKSERKMESRGAGKILIFGGYLKNLNYQVEPNGLRLGTPLLYGATHQLGDDSKNIPARPFIGASQADVDEMIRILNEWISEGIE
jgi:phage gpG-like protein